MSNYNDAVNEIEQSIAETGIGKIELSKEDIWLKKRVGKITASICPNLMTKGTKGAEFGKTALKEMYSVKYERRTGVSRESISHANFDWGHENEHNAIEWLKEQMMNTILSCSNDFDDIVFKEPFEGFGDSPDGLIYDFDGNVEGVLEVKCPVSVDKIEQCFEGLVVTQSDDYYWQFMAHFIGNPEAKYLIYLVYDGYSDNGVFVKLMREDYLDDIQILTNRIMVANQLINYSLKTGVPLESLI